VIVATLFTVLYLVISNDATVKALQWRYTRLISAAERKRYHAGVYLKFLLHYALLVSVIYTFELQVYNSNTDNNSNTGNNNSNNDNSNTGNNDNSNGNKFFSFSNPFLFFWQSIIEC
jgi:hypothetical protein